MEARDCSETVLDTPLLLTARPMSPPCGYSDKLRPSVYFSFSPSSDATDALASLRSVSVESGKMRNHNDAACLPDTRKHQRFPSTSSKPFFHIDEKALATVHERVK